jgi:hypothetical protein
LTVPNSETSSQHLETMSGALDSSAQASGGTSGGSQDEGSVKEGTRLWEGGAPDSGDTGKRLDSIGKFMDSVRAPRLGRFTRRAGQDYAAQARRVLEQHPELHMAHDRARAQDPDLGDWLLAKSEGLHLLSLESVASLTRALGTSAVKAAVLRMHGTIFFEDTSQLAPNDIGQYFPLPPLLPAAKLLLAAALSSAVVWSAWNLLSGSLTFAVMVAMIGRLIAPLWRVRGNIEVAARGEGKLVVSTTLHELAHRLHDQFLKRLPSFQKSLRKAYFDAAYQINGAQLLNDYQAKNIREYLAEGLAAYLNDGQGLMSGLTRADLRVKDPGLYALLDKHFGPTKPRQAALITAQQSR